MTGSGLPLTAEETWRCGGCLLSPVLGRYGTDGILRVVGRRRVSDYLFDAERRRVDARCPSCRAWRRLQFHFSASDCYAFESGTPEPWPEGHRLSEPTVMQLESELRQVRRQAETIEQRLLDLVEGQPGSAIACE